MKRLLSLAPFAVLFVFPFVTVQACGPDFFPDVFVRNLRPDHPGDYAAGKLGVLLPTYPRADLTVAYRYLNGGRLTPEEQKAYHPISTRAEVIWDFDSADADQAQAAANGTVLTEPPGLADLWLKARNKYAPSQPEIHPVREYGSVTSAGDILAGSYENCQSDAFHTAISTLENRAKVWGALSPELADWIKGQDAVFSNCGVGGYVPVYSNNRPVIHPSMPMPVTASASALLRQDRAYQVGAAQFYASQFDQASASFRSIAQDADSPWRGIARYLVARTLVREAFLKAPRNDNNWFADFDPALMKQAQSELEAMRGEKLPSISAHSVQSLLNLARLRTEPQARLREMSSALAGPKADPHYEQDLDDLAWYLNGKLDSLPVRESADDSLFHVDRPQNDYSSLTPEQKCPGFEKTFKDLSDLRSTSLLIDWLITFQSPAESAKKHALAEWKQTGSVPWLTVALLKASSTDTSLPALLEAAARVAPDSPAWATITYHRLRLLIDSGHSSEARTEIAAAFPTVQAIGSESTLNLFTGLRMRAAATLDAALGDTPRKVLSRTSEEHYAVSECLDVMKNPKRKYDCKKDSGPTEFSEDSAALLNRAMPLSQLAQAAQSSALPPQLRQSVAMMTWVRAVLLKNDAIAKQMFQVLPEKLRQQAGEGTGFHPLVTILRNPGLRPYLESGTQRSYTYDFVESYGDNWWCSDWTVSFGAAHSPVHSDLVSFQSAGDRDTAKNEVGALFALGSAEEYLGAHVVAYARANPSDPDVPEALFLTLRMMRYGCYHGYGWSSGGDKARADHIASIAREVGAIMRRRYPTNQWTKKAAPFVWVGEKKAE